MGGRLRAVCSSTGGTNQFFSLCPSVLSLRQKTLHWAPDVQSTGTRDALEGEEVSPPPPPGRPAYAQLLSP